MVAMRLFRNERCFSVWVGISSGGTGTPSPPLLSLLPRSRPPSLAFVKLTFLPQEAFGLASSSLFFCLCFFCRDIRNTIYDSWRTQLQPIRTIGEITAHIKIFPVHQPYLYQKLSRKAIQLGLLGMSYGEIAQSLHINKKTATKACEYGRR